MVPREGHRQDDILRTAAADDHQRFPIDHLIPDPPGFLVVFRPRADELSVQTRCKLFDYVLGDDHRSPSTDTHQSHRGASLSADPACVSRPGMVDSPKYLTTDPNRKGGSAQPFPNILTAPPGHGRANASSPRDGHRRHLLQGEGSEGFGRMVPSALGIAIEDTVALFTWRSGKKGKAKGHTVWSIFPAETPCTGPEERPVL